MEITDPAALSRAALEQVEAEPAEEEYARDQARAAVREDAAEALAYLVDPSELVAGVPGVELARASWGSETAGADPFADADDAVWELDPFGDAETVDGDGDYGDYFDEEPYDEIDDEVDDETDGEVDGETAGGTDAEADDEADDGSYGGTGGGDGSGGSGRPGYGHPGGGPRT